MSSQPASDRRSTPSVPERSVTLSRSAAARDAVSFCCQRRNLRRTIRIALVVGVVLTLINQGTVTATWLRCLLNFVVPFLVSNAGMLSARRPD